MHFTGWAIDRDYDARSGQPHSRVGYGMSDANKVLEDYDRIFLRQVSMETGLKASDVDDPIRFRIVNYDDGKYITLYTGSVSRDWFYSKEDLAYHIDNFAEADVGGSVQFRAADLDEDFVERHRAINCVVKSGREEWVITYG